MTVWSYAQNFEDVLLWRVLKGNSPGRYVDVGAGHPDLHSVTRLFYDAGWSGINVEPLPAPAAALRTSRPRDVVVEAAVTSNDVASVDLAIVADWEELSTISQERAESLQAQGRVVTTRSVPAVRLDALLDEHGYEQFEFLKIDVEGAELDVLSTVDLTRHRARVVVVEVNEGGEESRSRSEIRERLESEAYQHAWFDGLNDFFVARENAKGLLPSFAVPVNVTDEFLTASDSDRVLTGVVADRLGLQMPVGATEILQRIDALVRDRTQFERELQSANASEAGDIGGPHHRIEELTAALEEQQGLVRSLRLCSETLEQASFQRERLVAWYASEIDRYRTRCEEQETALAGQRTYAAHLDELVRISDSRLHEVLGSTSWRSTLPIRVLRRPRLYASKLVGK